MSYTARRIMAHEDVVFSALAHWRNRGVDSKGIRAFVRSRETRAGNLAKDERAVGRLAKQQLAFRIGVRWYLTPTGYKQARGHAAPGAWERSDAWILLAVLMGTEPCSLEQLIGAADYINHAIPTLEEIHGALNRGVAGKLVRVRRSEFEVTDAGRQLFAVVCESTRRAVGARRSGLARILECPHCGIALKAVRFRPYVDEADFDRAYSTYRARS